jgi:hypothetical protein
LVFGNNCVVLFAFRTLVLPVALGSAMAIELGLVDVVPLCMVSEVFLDEFLLDFLGSVDSPAFFE